MNENNEKHYELFEININFIHVNFTSHKKRNNVLNNSVACGAENRRFRPSAHFRFFDILLLLKNVYLLLRSHVAIYSLGFKKEWSCLMK